MNKSGFWSISVNFFREETFHQLPPAALLHDRQVDWIDDGGHSQAGGQDTTGTGQAAKGRIGAWDKANLVRDGPLEKKWVNWVKLSVGRAEIQQFTGRGRYVSHNCQKRASHRHRRRFKTSLLYYCTAIHPSLEFQSKRNYLRGFHFIWDLHTYIRN